MKIHRLGSVRNANRILKDLSPYLTNSREEYSTIYYLNKDGREYVNSKKIRKKNSFVNHVLMRNDYYIYSGFPLEWNNEMRLKDHEYAVICDAIYKSKGKYYCLEVDYKQQMKENRHKIQCYNGLFSNGVIKEQLGYFPTLIWITTTELRRKQLIELCKGLPHIVHTINDIK